MTPFERGYVEHDPNYDYEGIAKELGVPVEEIRKVYDETQTDEIWINDIYQVNIRRTEPQEGKIGMIHLSIKRRDKEPIHDWRDLQRIKNELTDPEFEALELYPAESRLVDTANQYHLWVLADKSYRIPVGFPGRLVYNGSGTYGAKQRPRE